MPSFTKICDTCNTSFQAPSRETETCTSCLLRPNRHLANDPHQAEHYDQKIIPPPTVAEDSRLAPGRSIEKGPRIYPEKVCLGCKEVYAPTGSRQQFCANCKDKVVKTPVVKTPVVKAKVPVVKAKGCYFMEEVTEPPQGFWLLKTQLEHGELFENIIQQDVLLHVDGRYFLERKPGDKCNKIAQP